MFPVRCSTPSSAALAEYLPALYDLGPERVRCYFAGQGWSDVYRVQAGGDGGAVYYLKVYAADWRTESEIRFELDFIAHLDRCGLSVALPVTGRDGEALYSLELPEGTRPMVLFQAAPGRPLAEHPADVQSRTVGTVMARFHQAAAGFASQHHRTPYDPEALLDLEPLEALAGKHPEELGTLQAIAERAARHLQALPLAEMRRGACHGDLGGANIFVDGSRGGATTVIDFDDCGPACFAYELGHVYLFLHLFRADESDRLWDVFLRSYQAEAPLDEVDLAAAPAFAVARLLQVHGNHNPTGALRDRWPAAGYVDGSQWPWLLRAARTLDARLGR